MSDEMSSRDCAMPGCSASHNVWHYPCFAVVDSEEINARELATVV